MSLELELIVIKINFWLLLNGWTWIDQLKYSFMIFGIESIYFFFFYQIIKCKLFLVKHSG